MCSKTQWAVFRERTAWRTSSPRSLSETSSPGWTSRISFAPTMSNAQLSEATRWRPSSSTPRASGRTPAGSRNATTASVVITTVE